MRKFKKKERKTRNCYCYYHMNHHYKFELRKQKQARKKEGLIQRKEFLNFLPVICEFSVCFFDGGGIVTKIEKK